ncbi:MAG TPA: TonB-dependent receptor [Allosphingosinicella sp.]
MKKFPLLGSSALRPAAVIGLSLALAAPAFAQEVADEADQPEQMQSEVELESGTDAQTGAQGEPAAAGEDQAITVTGSRIRRPNLESTVPITSVGGEEFFQTGQVSVGDQLNELPALRSTFSQSNSTRFLGTAGLNLLDLRGLGTQRTLVLQNGRRHVGADILNYATTVDVNQIPTDLIERVDVVTGGNSAIYGSDAIAGVVNFVLKQNFEGIQLRGQGGVGQWGEPGSYYASLLAGTNFADNRGNIAVNVEYAHQGDFYASQRKHLSRPSGFVIVDTDPASAPSDDEPDRRFFEDIRNATYTEGGSIYFCCDFIDPVGNPNIGNPGLFTIPYIFQPNGTLIPQTGERIGANFFGAFIGGNGSTFREGRQFGLQPRLDRYAINALGHFTVSDAFEPFFEAKYVRTDSFGNASGPFFTSATGSPREIFFTDNPFLNPQARSTILSNYGLGEDEDTYFYLFRSVTELGNREEKAKRETYRFVGGVRGDFNEDWSYEVSANYGLFKEKTKILGNVNLQRYLLAIDAVDEGLATGGAANGHIVCRAQVDPTAAVPYEFPLNEAFAQSQLAADVAACVPVNLFGAGNITPEARNYLTQDTLARGRIEQFVVNGFLSGDTSQWFELPGGPVGFALGAEYRREDAHYIQDPVTASGLTFYNAIPEFDPTSFEVKEAFAEIRLPILRDVPFFQELTISAAGRVADYKGATGTVFAYNAGAEWAPVRDLRFRGNFSRAVRAPNLADLYTPLGQNFAPGFVDPCALANIGAGAATREANCQAAGVPADFDYQYTSSLGFLSGGNPNLNEETSDSLTLGGVFQPRFFPGFALSVDYYNITVNKVITSPSAQQIVDACYDASDLNNQFCALFSRAGAGGGPRGEIEGQILENSLQVIPLNYAKLKVRGIDAEASYRHTFPRVGTLSTRVIYTHVLQADEFLNPGDPGRADQYLLELGDPKDSFNWNLDFKSGPVTVGYQMRYLGKMLLNTAEYEFFFSKQGREPSNPDWAERRFYPSIFYHDVRLSYDVGKDFNFYLGIDDVTNRRPPLGASGIGGGSGIYRNIGRFFYAGAVAKF